MVEIKEEEYKEFFTWILGRKVELKKELDITLAHDYQEPYIYYTSEILEFFETTPMKRTGKIVQLGSSILSKPNIYHTRLEHCKGAYKNALDFWLLRCKNEEYRKEIEESKSKVKILADIMEMARHDDCHPMLSHSLEGTLCNGKINHEDIGKRNLLENKEYEIALNKIQDGLYDEMCRNTLNESNFQFLKEGNIDFDRMDYMVRDALYLGEPQLRNIVENLNEKCSIRKININGQTKEVPVYANETLKDIEEFLTIRQNGYINEYSSPARNVLDRILRCFCQEIMYDKTNLGRFIKQSIKNYTKDTIDEIDLEEFLQTDDIKFYSDAIEIAQKHPNSEIREFASLCIPNVTALIQIAIEILDPKNRIEPYDEVETKFIHQIQELKDQESELSSKLKEPKMKSCITVVPENNLEYEEIKAKISDYMEEDCNQIFGIISWNRRIKMYKQEEPIYIEDEYGSIHTLDKHPELSIDLSDKQIYGVCAIPVQMKLKGYSKDQINGICNILSEYEKEQNIREKQDINRMSMFKVGNKPYIIGFEER